MKFGYSVFFESVKVTSNREQTIKYCCTSVTVLVLIIVPWLWKSLVWEQLGERLRERAVPCNCFIKSKIPPKLVHRVLHTCVCLERERKRHTVFLAPSKSQREEHPTPNKGHKTKDTNKGQQSSEPLGPQLHDHATVLCSS